MTDALPDLAARAKEILRFNPACTECGAGEKRLHVLFEDDGAFMTIVCDNCLQRLRRAPAIIEEAVA
jgi:hypothetical protein